LFERARLNIVYSVKHMPKPDPAALALGDFEQLVLLALFRLGPDAYGATIRREIEHRTGRDLAMSAVYVTIDRLEAKGLVRTRVGDPIAERGGRRRKHVMLLPAGRRAVNTAYRRFKAMVEGLEHRLDPA
jgi:PadR family transcriptional regulator, regulatory protein PadR